MLRTRTEITTDLTRLADQDVFDYWLIQTKMPGLRWTIYSVLYPTGRGFTIAEVDAFIDGADLALVADIS